jgi:hypothetical protein
MSDERKTAIKAGKKAIGIGPTYECENCGRQFTDADETDGEVSDEGWRHYIHHLQDRVAPGEPMPAGECHHCGALVHITDE